MRACHSVVIREKKNPIKYVAYGVEYDTHSYYIPIILEYGTHSYYIPDVCE